MNNLALARKVNGDFILKERETLYGDITIDGNLTARPYASFLDTVRMTNKKKAVLMESHAFIYHLCIMSGGEIFFMDKNCLIDTLTIEGKVIIHIPDSTCELQDFVNNINGVSYKVIRDID